MMPPLQSITEQIENIKEVWRFAVERWQNFQRETGEIEMDSFLYYINNVSGLPEDTLRMIQGGLELSILEYCRTYFLSLQSTFKDFKIQEQEVKTNILVWSLSEPEFKLFVEYDELGYYADETSFSVDRARDRLLQAKGYQVLRFSAQEIFSNPLGMAEELIKYLMKHSEDRMNSQEQILLPDHYPFAYLVEAWVKWDKELNKDCSLCTLRERQRAAYWHATIFLADVSFRDEDGYVVLDEDLLWNASCRLQDSGDFTPRGEIYFCDECMRFRLKDTVPDDQRAYQVMNRAKRTNGRISLAFVVNRANENPGLIVLPDVTSIQAMLETLKTFVP